jgi:hypothetical protein
MTVVSRARRFTLECVAVPLAHVAVPARRWWLLVLNSRTTRHGLASALGVLSALSVLPALVGCQSMRPCQSPCFAPPPLNCQPQPIAYAPPVYCAPPVAPPVQYFAAPTYCVPQCSSQCIASPCCPGVTYTQSRCWSCDALGKPLDDPFPPDVPPQNPPPPPIR